MPPLPPPRHSTSHAIYSLQNTYAPHMTQRPFTFLAYHIAGVTKERTTSILPFNEKIPHMNCLVRTHPSGMHSPLTTQNDGFFCFTHFIILFG